jgi:hypothetical protein
MEFQDGPFRVSDNDILISRRRVRDFLSQKTAYDLLPDSGKVLQIHSSLSLSLSLVFCVINYIIYLLFIALLSPYWWHIFSQVIALDVNLPVKQSFHILHEQVNFSIVTPLDAMKYVKNKGNRAIQFYLSITV